MKHIESKRGLNTLLKRVHQYTKENIKALGTKDLEEVNYWISCIKGCINENLAMDEIDYENAPSWFRPLWKGLK